MADQSHQLVQKLWNYCNILRDDGLSYGDYVEQLTFLLFLKMAHEQSRPPFNKPSPIPRVLGKLNGSQSGVSVSPLDFRAGSEAGRLRHYFVA